MLESLNCALNVIRAELGQPLIETSTFPVSPKEWLLEIASDRSISATAAELRGRSCRSLLDSIDEVLT
ncbi:hypothetical protein DL93DRAFT_2085944 [Clavulina sp. PMI_390]|nr:hypothetical protein DL93DRAFT_2085944 [Clavulina sp. PMI_390]